MSKSGEGEVSDSGENSCCWSRDEEAEGVSLKGDGEEAREDGEGDLRSALVIAWLVVVLRPARRE